MDTIFWLVPAASLLALSFAFIFFKQMMKEDEGTDLMKKIALHVRKGAMAYLKQQYKVVGIVFVVLAAIFAVIIIGKDVSALLPTDSVTANENYLGNFFKTNDTSLVARRTEVFILEKDGTRTNVLATLSEASTGESYTLTAFIQKIEVELL